VRREVGPPRRGHAGAFPLSRCGRAASLQGFCSAEGLDPHALRDPALPIRAAAHKIAALLAAGCPQVVDIGMTAGFEQPVAELLELERRKLEVVQVLLSAVDHDGPRS
jgi:hypothetical protein